MRPSHIAYHESANARGRRPFYHLTRRRGMTARSAPAPSALLLMLLLQPDAFAGEPLDAATVKGTVRCAPTDDAKCDVPERYRIKPFDVDYTLAPRFVLRHSGVEVYDLTFPSPVK